MDTIVWSEKPFFYEGCRTMMWYNRKTQQRAPYYCNGARCNRKKCVENWARRRIAVANGVIQKYGLTRFFTLTVDRSMSCSEAWESMNGWWRTLRSKLRYFLSKTDRKLKYFAVLEAHKDGYPHIHGFWNVFVRQEYLEKLWSESAPGYVVWLEAIQDSESASKYLGMDMGKYIGKEQSVQGARMANHRQRTLWRSQGLRTDFELDSKQDVCDTDWELIKENNYGKTHERQDMEGARESLPEVSVDKGEYNMEAETKERLRSKEDQGVTRQERQDKRRDQETAKQLEWSDLWPRDTEQDRYRVTTVKVRESSL